MSAIIDKQRKFHPKSLANLRPFPKGVSGNPGGRAKGEPELSAAYMRLLALPLEEFNRYEPKNVVEEIAVRVIKTATGENAVSALAAVKEITDRTEGKPQQQKQASGAVRYEDGQAPRDAQGRRLALLADHPDALRSDNECANDDQ